MRVVISVATATIAKTTICSGNEAPARAAMPRADGSCRQVERHEGRCRKLEADEHERDHEPDREPGRALR